jgi:hypothetical protein
VGKDSDFTWATRNQGEPGATWIGRIGRSMGPVKIPIVLSNRRSIGGHGLLDTCVIKIEYANKSNGGVVWKHPAYQANETL